MSTSPTAFPKAWNLLTLAAENGWAVAWQPGTDAAGNEYVTVRAVRGRAEHRVTWHTRHPDGAAGTPRMQSALTNDGRWRDTTLQAVTTSVTSATEEAP